MAKEKTGKVVIYTTAYCSFCNAAKIFLKSKDIKFEEIDVTGDDETREKLVRMSGGRETVPQIFVDGQPLGGYDDLVAYYRSGKTL